MGVAIFVIEHGALLDGILGDRPVDMKRAAGVGSGRFNGELQRVENAPRVAVCHFDKMVERIIVDERRPVSIAPLRIGNRKKRDAFQIVSGQGLELEYPRSRYERLVHFKVRVFRGRAD